MGLGVVWDLVWEWVWYGIGYGMGFGIELGMVWDWVCDLVWDVIWFRLKNNSKTDVLQQGHVKKKSLPVPQVGAHSLDIPNYS